MKNIIKKIPGAKLFYNFLRGSKKKQFTTSRDYWIRRYKTGGDSAAPKFLTTCKFKADKLNEFSKENLVNEVIEFGCGEGVQTSFFKFRKYLGFDVSPHAISKCRKSFKDDPSKKFKLVKQFSNEKADITLSLDVIYHLVEDEVFADYMKRLFSSARRFVGIFAPDTEDSREDRPSSHVRYRKYSLWIEENAPRWQLILDIPNPYHAEEGKTDRDPVSRLRIYKLEDKASLVL